MGRKSRDDDQRRAYAEFWEETQGVASVQEAAERLGVSVARLRHKLTEWFGSSKMLTERRLPKPDWEHRE